MKFSVVIPTYNRLATLRQTLAALVAQDYAEYEIIVVDDGSTDGTDAMIAAEFRMVRYLQQANRGPAAARNAGIRAAQGEVIAFTDDDCIPPHDWLTRLADGYARYPHIVGAGGYLEAPADVLLRNRLAQYEYHISHVTYAAGDCEYLGGFECPAGGTNSMSYQRSVLTECGGFDESFPYAAGEDADLKWRICQRGYQLLYLPTKVIHLQPYTWQAFRKQQITHGRGAIYFDRKHTQMPSRLRLIMRVVKRGLLFCPDGLRLGLRLAWIKLWAGWYECWGQWLEVSQLRAANVVHTAGR